MRQHRKSKRPAVVTLYNCGQLQKVMAISLPISVYLLIISQILALISCPTNSEDIKGKNGKKAKLYIDGPTATVRVKCKVQLHHVWPTEGL